MLAPPEREDFPRRSGGFSALGCRIALAFFTLPARWRNVGFSCRAAPRTRCRSGKPHTAATRASRRGAGAWRTRRVDRDDFFHSGKIGTIDPFQADEALTVALSERYGNTVLP